MKAKIGGGWWGGVGGGGSRKHVAHGKIKQRAVG